MDNSVLILTKIICALFYNGKADTKAPEIYDELQELVRGIKVDPRATGGLGGEDTLIEALRDTVEWMLYHREGNYNTAELIQRITINLQGNVDYLAIATGPLNDEIEPSIAEARLTCVMQELRYEKKRTKIKQMIAKANAKVNFSGEYIEMGPFLNEMMTDLEGMQTSNNDQITGLVGSVDFSKKEQVMAALDKGTSLINPEGLLNLGLQGLNDALGGGAMRGHLYNFDAMTHNYKSGILVDVMVNIPVFNKPWMWDEKKKPLLYRISFEDTIDKNIMEVYVRAYEATYGAECDTKNVSLEEASEFIMNYYHSRGYHFIMEHYDPTNFTVYDLFTRARRLMDEGYEIHAISCDYLPLIAHNTIGERMESKIQNTYQMIRNFFFPKGVTFFTAAQLQTKVKDLIDQHGSASITKRICDLGMTQECGALFTKVDAYIVMHIHKHIDGNKYLSFSKGKHRGGERIPERLKHFYYMFQAIGGIVPDVGEGRESKALYSLPQGMDSGASAVWDE